MYNALAPTLAPRVSNTPATPHSTVGNTEVDLSMPASVNTTLGQPVSESEAIIADASEFLDVFDDRLVYGHDPTDLSLHISVLANAAHRAKLLLRVPLSICLPGDDHDAALLMWPLFVHPAKPSQGVNPTASIYAQYPDANYHVPPTASLVGTLFPACLVLCPCVVAPPPDFVRFCPGALACALILFCTCPPMCAGALSLMPAWVWRDVRSVFFYFFFKHTPAMQHPPSVIACTLCALSKTFA